MMKKFRFFPKIEPNERLFIHRKRQGWNQEEAANYHETTHNQYRMWETGRDTEDVPCVHVKYLLNHEKCVLTRRRQNLEVTELAEIIGRSRWWTRQMESGRESPVELMEYWATRQRSS